MVITNTVHTNGVLFAQSPTNRRQFIKTLHRPKIAAFLDDSSGKAALLKMAYYGHIDLKCDWNIRY